MFLLVPAYPGCPGSKAVKRSLLLLLLFLAQFSATESSFMGMSVSTLVIHAKTTIPIEMSVGGADSRGCKEPYILVRIRWVR